MEKTPAFGCLLAISPHEDSTVHLRMRTCDRPPPRIVPGAARRHVARTLVNLG